MPAYTPRLDILRGLVMANVVSSSSFGVTTIQTWQYFRNFPGDRRITKSSVALLWVTHGTQIYCSSRATYWYFVTHFGNESALYASLWETRMPLGANVLASLALQAYLTWKIYQLSASRILALFSGTLVLTAFAFGLVLFVTACHSYDAWVKIPRWAILAWAASCAFADATLASVLTVLLWRRQRGVDRTNKAVTHMIMHVVNAGVLTSLLSLALVAVVVAGKATYSTLLAETYGHLYTIAVLSILHSRSRLLELRDTSLIQLRTLGVMGEPVVVTVERETQRASFHNGEAENALWSRIESRYPQIESRTYREPRSEPEGDTDIGYTGHVEEDIMVASILAV